MQGQGAGGLINRQFQHFPCTGLTDRTGTQPGKKQALKSGSFSTSSSLELIFRVLQREVTPHLPGSGDRAEHSRFSCTAALGSSWAQQAAPHSLHNEPGAKEGTAEAHSPSGI